MFWAKADRSRTYWSIAIAGRWVGWEDVEIMPNGMLASEKWLFEGMGSQDAILGVREEEKDTTIWQ